ncbi:hypothetical protein CGK42_20590 [Vibrio parahaemolyticus]|uniref:restriction endonuclease subunit S n=1 Tax=Vibrio parahaemolyticus TaxID=670 RepID=UPI00117269F2|nr:restriction endonuclease subunit S [Vibrio parahaemolyticus]TNZ67681.1 hypothetical protein CGK42_20590 [Vibrio parahaemolyticus]
MSALEQVIPEGYKQTEAGVIPDDWDVVSLGDIGNTVIGLTYSPKDVADYGSLVLRSSNIQKNRLAYENNVFVDMDLPERVIVKEGDILVCVRNGSRNLIGKCALIDKNAEGSAFGAFMSIYRTKQSKFIFFQFQSNIIQNQINEIMGATINQITNKDMAGFKVLVPRDEKEQTAIANALSNVDALLTELEKLIAKKQAIKTATMQQLLTGKTRLPQFATYTEGEKQGQLKGTKTSELGEIPEDWGTVELAVVCTLKSGLGITSKDIDSANQFPCYGGNGLRGYTKTYTHEGDFALIGRQGALCGNIQFASGKFFASEHALVATPSKGNDAKWLAIYLERMNLNQYSESSAQPGLSAEKLRLLKIITPPPEEQTAIATILSDMDNEIQALEQRLAKTHQIKQGMMQELLTGRTRLPFDKES